MGKNGVPGHTSKRNKLRSQLSESMVIDSDSKNL